MLAIINFDTEFAFNSIVDKDASFNIQLVVLVIPVRFECNWYTLPSVWIDVTKSVSSHFNDSLCHYMWLLIQVMMVLVWIVEASHSGCRELVQMDLSLHCLEAGQHFFSLINY